MARSTARTNDPVASLAAQVEALAAMVASLAANAPAAPLTVTPNPRVQNRPAKRSGRKTLTTAATKTTKGAKVYTWKPWACAKFGIPSTVGASFAYSGKNGTTDHIVTGVTPDGIVSSIRA